LSLGSGQTGKTADWPEIPGFELIELLGEGGGGRVFKAEQLKAGRRVVAIKVLHGVSKLERERMKREAESLGRISHPNIVKIYEVGESDEGPYFTMEYMSGATLAERIKKEKLDPMESARIVEGVARGVAAAHELKIWHRDLKPSNVLLAADGTPKVSDFGLAKFADVAGDATTLERMTPTGAILGTPAYMAPEAAAGRTKEIDERTDVYGIGAILYHCLTGRAPFMGETQVEIAGRVMREEVALPRSYRRDIPRDLEAVCVKCIERSKARRYATAVEVSSELLRAVRGEPTLVRPLGSLARAWRKLKRNRRTIATVTAAVLLVVAALAARAALNRPPKDPMDVAYEDLAKAMQGNEPVTLVGETGRPKWFSWKDGEVPFTESMYKDGVCAFQTLDQSQLELVPSELLPPAGFVLDFEARHDANKHYLSNIGVYFTDWIWEVGENYQARVVYRIRWNDHQQPFDPLQNRDPSTKMIVCDALATQQTPGMFASKSSTFLGDHKMHVEDEGTPRSWRRVRITATPERLLVTMVQNGSESDFSTMPRDIESLRKVTRTQATQLFPDRAALPDFNLPHWGPKGSLGLFVDRGIGSFRNVVISPIHSP
jgi:serine/threonine-protein kinase